MEEFFKLLLSKRRTRQLSSDSSLDTSPEPKKLKECDSSNSSEGEREEEGDDIILSALNMAEGLQKLGFGDAANVEIKRVHRLGKKRDPYLLDSYDIRTVKSFFRWDIVYEEQTTKCTKIFRLRSSNVGERRWKPSKRQDNIPAAFSKAQPDKLFIRGKLWPFGMPLITQILNIQALSFSIFSSTNYVRYFT